MSIDIGDIVTVETDPPFTDADGAPLDPGVVILSWRHHDDALDTVWTYLTDSEVVRDEVGTYHADIGPVRSGVYYFKWWGDPEGGVLQASEESSFTVRHSRLGIPEGTGS